MATLKAPNATTISFSASLSSGASAPLLRRGGVPFGHGRRRASTINAKIREIFMPALSSTMTEGKIVSWTKSEGDQVNKGDPVVVVESDKADMDVETFNSGILAAIVVGDGETAPVGAPIAFVAETEEEVPEAKARAQQASSTSAPPPQKAEPSIEPPPAVKETPKVAATAPSPSGKTVATPHAKKLAKQHKVDLNKLAGTGPFGRVTPEDVEKAAGIVSKPKASVTDFAAKAISPPPPTAAAKGGASSAIEIPEGASVVPFTTMQAAVSRNMVESLSVPTFRVGYPIETDKLDALYEKLKPKGVTMTALLAKAAAMALVQHPVVNASCKDGKSFSYNSSINIACAVAINGGLITPVLQEAEKLDLYLLSQKWKELVEKARAKQLQPHEYSSGTFTLSNLGMFGVDRFDAILPPGQGAIMAVGASKPTVVTGKDGYFSVKSKMLVNVTADHRIIYGADLAAFLQTFEKIVANPESLTM